MSPVRKLFSQAMHMSEKERAELATKLIVSLDPKVDPADEVEIAWQREIQRRLSQIKNHEVRMIPWATVKRRLHRKIHA